MTFVSKTWKQNSECQTIYIGGLPCKRR